MRAYGWAWLAVAVLVGAPGVGEAVLAVPPLTAWTAGVAVAAITALSHLSYVARRGASTVPGRRTWLATALGGLAGVTMTGLSALLGGGGVVLVLLVVAGHPRVLLGVARRVRRLPRHDGARPPVAPARRPSAAPGRAAGGPAWSRDRTPKVVAGLPVQRRWPDVAGVRQLTLGELCWGWRASFTALERVDPRTDQRRWPALVAVRRHYLDEIARRDPAGFARWIYAGARPASDPTRYLLVPQPRAAADAPEAGGPRA